MKPRFRGEKDDEWVDFREVEGGHVRDLQTGLRAAGFYPQGAVDGVFGYRTLSGARLFQEYVRSVDGAGDIGAPDGIVGPKTHAHLAQWKATGRRADWTRFSWQAPMPEYRYWIRVLSLYRDINAGAPVHRMVSLANTTAASSDTLKIAQWRADSTDLNLIGIRRQEWQVQPDRGRANDDLFILLVNGLVFKFYGSTDPSPKLAEKERLDEPYIVRGQHAYRFGWHKVTKPADEPTRVYRAFKPARYGVLVCRDTKEDDVLTDEDLGSRLEANPTVNIHWSGAGSANWSAGCQVIAGRKYVNYLDQVVDCSAFAAPAYKQLDPSAAGRPMTRAAYNVLLDLLTIHAPNVAVAGGTSLFYTLIYERDFAVPVRGGRPFHETALADVVQSGSEAAQVGKAVGLEGLVGRLVRG